MIKLILSGGLGNQMFQYAAARALSLRHDTDMAIDLYMLNKKTRSASRDYELGVFNIDIPESHSIRNILLVKSYKYLVTNTLGRASLNFMHIFKDLEAQTYDERFKTLPKETTLIGYFQNEKYFANYMSDIRSDFRFTKSLDPKNAEQAEQIYRTESVSLHIRRTDYLNNNSNLCVLDIDYYQRAIQYMRNHLENPHFYIFSDDTDWVKQHLKIENSAYTCIDWNEAKNSYKDMQLMSHCKHNIIANSSFSWWAAWLNSNSHKIVISPSVWYKNLPAHAYPPNFIPQEWVIL